MLYTHFTPSKCVLGLNKFDESNNAACKKEEKKNKIREASIKGDKLPL